MLIKKAVYTCSHVTTDLTFYFCEQFPQRCFIPQPQEFLSSWRCQDPDCEYQKLQINEQVFYIHHGISLQPVYYDGRPPEFKLEVLYATYGGVDVTTQIAQLVEKKQGLILDARDNINEICGDPLLGQPKQLHITYRYYKQVDYCVLDEYNGKLLGSLDLRSEKILTMKNVSGLSNQLMGVAAATLIAQKLARRIPLASLQFIARMVVTDGVHDDRLRRSFTDLFDPDRFCKECPGPIDAMAPAPVDSGLVVAGRGGFCISSNEIREKFQQAEEHLAIDDPFTTIVPSHLADYAFVREVLAAFHPAPRLQQYVSHIQGSLTTCVPRYNVLHYRYAADWPFAKNAPTNGEYFLGLLQQFPFPEPHLPVYVCGVLTADDKCQIRQQLSHVYFKTDFCPGIEEILGYEELAIVDREIALGAAHFVGHADSTFGLLYAIQRNGKDYTFYDSVMGLSHLPPLLMKPHHQPLFTLP